MAFFQRCKQRFDSKNVGSETVFGRTRRKPPPEQKHRAPRHKYGFLRRTLWLRYKLSRTCKLLCMLERGDCQIGFEPKEVCWRLISTPKSFVFLDALRFIKVRIVFVTQEKLASWPQAFSTRIEFEDRYTKGIFLLSKIISSRGLQDMKLTLKEPLL